MAVREIAEVVAWKPADVAGGKVEVEYPPSAYNEFFQEEMAKLGDRVQVEVERHGTEAVWVVSVQPDDRASEMEVYNAEYRVYERFPRAYLRVFVEEARAPVPPNGLAG